MFPAGGAEPLPDPIRHSPHGYEDFRETWSHFDTVSQIGCKQASAMQPSFAAIVLTCLSCIYCTVHAQRAKYSYYTLLIPVPVTFTTSCSYF